MKATYGPDEPVEWKDLEPEVDAVTAEDALGHTYRTTVDGRVGRVGPLPPATYALRAWAGSRPAACVTTTVEARPGTAPVPAFVTSTGDDAGVQNALRWVRRLGASVVQVYDWMEAYSHPAPSADLYTDPLGRRLSRSALTHLNAELYRWGAVPEAYAPVYGADPAAAEAWPQLRLYGPDGSPQRLADLVAIMHPGRPEWIARWLESWSVARDLGFRGFHLDTYGYPRAAVDADGAAVDMPAAYRRLVDAVRDAFPDFLLTFNQVNTHPAGQPLPAPPSARYVEVWPPNDAWRHLEGVLHRAGAGPDHATVLAIYPPVWEGDRADALRTVCLTEAVVTLLGADLLVWGDQQGVLCDPYYPRHVHLADAEAATALDWHAFALRCRDLFRRGRDTTWEDVGGVNTAVTVSADAPASPEPLGGGLFVRVRRGPGWVAVGVLNQTGSANGRWTEGSGVPTATAVTVAAALPGPGAWRAYAAVLGQREGRFDPVPMRTVGHGEGTALSVDIPSLDRWAVVLFRTGDASW